MKEEIQDIEELTERYDDLNRKKIRAEGDLERARKDLEEYRKEAEEMYGSSDIGVLKQRLNEMIQENDRKKMAYQQSLDQIEQGIVEIEGRMNDESST